jgi:MFS family permease
VQEPARPEGQRRVRNPLARAELRLLGARYWWVVVVAAIFTLARFSEAFLILKAQSAGLSLVLIPLVLVGMNAVYAAAAWPIGALSDRAGTTGLLGLGLALLVLADIVLAYAPGLGGVAVGVLLWGLHMGFSQGLLSALVAGAVPPELRGTAFGLFNLVTGVRLLLAASVIAVRVWDDRSARSGRFSRGRLSRSSQA